MTFLSRHAILAAVVVSVIGLLGVGLVDRAAAQANQTAAASGSGSIGLRSNRKIRSDLIPYCLG